MRVVLNALQAGNRSGTGRYIVELVKRLPEHSRDLDFGVIWPRHVPHPDVSAGAREVFHLVDTQSPLHRLWHDQFGIRADMKRLKADVVHYPASIGPLFDMRNVVLTIHDLAFIRDPSWHRSSRTAYYTFAVRRSARFAKRIIVDSAATAADVHDIIKVPMDRIDVVPLGVGEEFLSAGDEAQAVARRKYHLPHSFLLYVGTLEPRKNLVRLIDAFSRIAGTCECDLVLAGRDGWKVGPIWAAAAASPYATRIHFPGFIEDGDLPAILSAARVFAWPSLWEGFGLPPLDAMACGTPVVSSNSSSMPEVMGDAALLFDPCDVDAISEAMLEAASEGALREGMKAKGLARAATFTWDRTAQAVIQTYLKILAE